MLKGSVKNRGTLLENRKLDNNVTELKNISEGIRKQNIRVGDISKELYENNILIQQLRKEIYGFKELIHSNENQKDLIIQQNKLNEYSETINHLKKQLIDEKNSKIKVQEELLAMYEKEERLLKSHRKLLIRYRALSNSKLGKLTFAYWEFLRRLKRGK